MRADNVNDFSTKPIDLKVILTSRRAEWKIKIWICLTACGKNFQLLYKQKCINFIRRLGGKKHYSKEKISLHLKAISWSSKYEHWGLTAQNYNKIKDWADFIYLLLLFILWEITTDISGIHESIHKLCEQN